MKRNKKNHSEQPEMTPEEFMNQNHAAPENQEPKEQEENVKAQAAEVSAETKDNANEIPTPDNVEDNKDQKINELQDKYLRLSAEFDNYRKRTIRERADLIKSAGEDVLSGILPVVDNFERALAHLTDAKEPDAIKEGILLIYNKFREFISQRGIKEISALNLPFDADLHDAVAKMPVTEKEKHNLIIDVVEKGYYLNDKIIRHAKVVVGEYRDPHSTQN